ncbi:MAG: hypothetical protein KatS3mg115_1859 [Candidatus Poribacteria bacterium]|nr:MAG: hypothetical protein KatS3mg115_1859 [Candidatus Poribacteria bacterium]
MTRKLRIACIGGGTGLSTLLRGLRRYALQEGEEKLDMDGLTAIVSVSDDGGSSGRLIDEFGVLPPGDIRNCLVALADEEETISRLFEYRFQGNGHLKGHSVGNLLLIALSDLFGSFPAAIQEGFAGSGRSRADFAGHPRVHRALCGADGRDGRPGGVGDPQASESSADPTRLFGTSRGWDLWKRRAALDPGAAGGG